MMKVMLMVVESAMVIALEKVAVIQMIMLNTIALVIDMTMGMATLLVVVMMIDAGS